MTTKNPRGGNCTCQRMDLTASQHAVTVEELCTSIKKDIAVKMTLMRLTVEIFLICLINRFLANVLILYPLKTPENLWFSGVFRGYKMGALARNRLTNVVAIHDEADNITYYF